MKIKITQTESFSSFIVKQIELETDDHDFLEGLSKEDICSLIDEEGEGLFDFGPDGHPGQGNVVKHETSNEQKDWKVE